MSNEVIKDFIKKSEYLNSLLDEVDNVGIDNISSDLYYELVYASKYLDRVVAEKEYNSIAGDINTLQKIFKTLLNEIKPPAIENSKENKHNSRETKYKKLLEKRVEHIEQECIEDKITKHISANSLFLRKITPILTRTCSMILLICLIALISMLFWHIDGSSMTHILSDILGINANDLQGTINIAISLARLIYLVAVVSTVCKIIISTICFKYPMFKETPLKELSIPETLDDNIRNGINEDRIKLSYSRIKCNKQWLKEMSKEIDSKYKNKNAIGKNKIGNYSLEAFKDKLNDYERYFKNVNSASLEYYEKLVEIELLHNEFKEWSKESNIENSGEESLHSIEKIDSIENTEEFKNSIKESCRRKISDCII